MAEKPRLARPCGAALVGAEVVFAMAFGDDMRGKARQLLTLGGKKVVVAGDDDCRGQRL